MVLIKKVLYHELCTAHITADKSQKAKQVFSPIDNDTY